LEHGDPIVGTVALRYGCIEWRRSLRHSINIKLDRGCNHRAAPANEDLHRNAAGDLSQADALFFGRVTYEMMLLSHLLTILADDLRSLLTIFDPGI
jgi:hypothetical protein